MKNALVFEIVSRCIPKQTRSLSGDWTGSVGAMR